MSTAVVPFRDANPSRGLEGPIRVLPIRWGNPHSVPAAELTQHIHALENACRQNPESPDLRTCLGMAYAMNFQVYKSMDALEEARHLDNTHFFAQFKYAELLYRLRALLRAEQETIKAIDLAQNHWELSLARKQLLEIRERTREGTQKPEWDRPLAAPAIALLTLFVILSCIFMLSR